MAEELKKEEQNKPEADEKVEGVAGGTTIYEDGYSHSGDIYNPYNPNIPDANYGPVDQGAAPPAGDAW